MRRFGTALALIAVLLVVAWGVLHVVITPVNPEQQAPDGHVDSVCWACHLVLSSAEIVD